jgi:hypothetical protein
VPTNFVVTSTADSGIGSLRDAIVQVNADKTDNPLNPDRINFGIHGSGLQTIQPVSPLPILVRPVVIDGYTQPGTQQNTSATGDNAHLLIDLNGSLAPTGSNGLTISAFAGFSTIRGLIIGGFTNGILIGGVANRLQGDFVLLNHYGVSIVGNASANLVGTDENNPQIVDIESDGLSDLGERNLIAGNTFDGVLINTASGNYIAGNDIGTDLNGKSTPLYQNAGAGVRITNGGHNNVIGGDTRRANLIAFNRGGGVVVQGNSSIGNSIQVNSIYENQPLDIDLGGTGVVTLNDSAGHVGPNNFQNFPDLTSAQPGATTLVKGTLASAPNTAYTIDVYASTLPSPVAFQGVVYGGGQRWLGSVAVTTDATGNASFAQTLLAATSASEWIAATATASAGNTSEFSIAHQLPIPVLNTSSWIPIGPAPTSVTAVGRIDVAAPDPANANVMYVGANDGGIWKTTNWLDPFPIWKSLTDLPQVSSLAIHEHDLVVVPGSSGRGSIVLAAASGPGGGILRSDDGGTTWAFLAAGPFDSAEFSALVVDPNSPDATTLYAAVSNGLVDADFLPQGYSQGLYKSVNGGVTWFDPTNLSPVFSGSVSDLLGIQENGQAVLYAADTGNPNFPGGIYRSADGGVTWQKTNLPVTTAVGGAIRLAGATMPTEQIYASIIDSSGNVQRFVSSDEGADWSSVGYPVSNDTGDRYRHNLLAVDPANSNTVFANADKEEHVFRGTNGGQTWQDLGYVDAASGTFDLKDSFVLCHDNGIWRLNPDTSAFERKSGNLNTNQFYTFTADPTNRQVAFGTAQDFPATLKFVGTPQWQYNKVPNPPPKGYAFESGKILVDPTQAKQIDYLNPGGPGDRFVYSNDGGYNWVTAISGLPTDANGTVPAYGTPADKALAMDPNNPNRLALGLYSVYLTTTRGNPNSTDMLYKGNGWRDIGAGMGNNGQPITAISIDPSDPNTIYAGTIDGHIFATNSDGAPTTQDPKGWHEADGGLPLNGQTVMDLKVDPADPSVVFAVTSSYVGRDDQARRLGAFPHVWISFNNGGLWYPIQGNLPTEVGGESLAVDSRPQPNAAPILYLGTQRGAFWSTDLGTTWTQFDSLPRTRVTDLDFVPALDLLGAGTLGRGAYEILVKAPVPSTASISLNTVVEGSPSIPLTVYGVNFVRSSSVQVNGRPVATTFVNTGQLQATIDSSFFAKAGALNITVFTPGPGGGTSNRQTLTITDAPFAVSAGGPSNDFGQAVSTDAVGNVYVAGNVQYASPTAAPFGAFVSKYAPDGTLLWTQNIFGDVTDTAAGIAVDPAGNAFVTGFFRGVANFGPGFVITPSSSASYNGFIEKLDPNGIVQWVREIDAPLSAGGDAVALDAADNVYSTGFLFGSARFFGPGGQVLTNPMNTNQGTSFLVKQDTNGNLLWVQQFGIPDPTLGGGDLSSANAIAVNPAGTAIYVAGGFRGQNVLFGTTSLSVAGADEGGPTNTFVERFDGAGISQWAVRAGSATILQGEAEAARGIALDSQGNPYITGSFDNTADFGNFQLVGINGANTYVAKLDPNGPAGPNGAFVNAVRFADNGDAVGTAIAVDQFDNIYTTGWFLLTAHLGPFQLTSRGDLDVYVAKLDPNLKVLAAHQLGGAGRDRGLGIAVDVGGFVDITGSFTGTGTFSFPPNAPVILTSAGGTDVFVSHQRLVSSPVRVTVLNGNILQIQGDDTANRIALTDDGHGTIGVLLDDDALRVYAGIDQIQLTSGGGDDVVSYGIGDPDLFAGPDTRPADLMVVLGNGNDTFKLSAYFGPFHTPRVQPWNVHVKTGDGNDTVNANTVGSLETNMETDLGAGNDTAFELHDWTFGVENPSTIGSATPGAGMTVNGGSGKDDIRVINDISPQPGAPAVGGAPITVNVNGGTGTSHILIEWLFDALPGNPGDPPPNFSIPLTTNIHTRGTNDDVRVIYAWNPNNPLLGFPRLGLNAPISLNIDGGKGTTNTFAVEFFHDPAPDRTAPPLFLNNAFSVNMRGGSGTDVMNLDIGSPTGVMPNITSGGSVNVRLAAGAGSETIAANMWYDPDTMGPVNAKIIGGAGIDDLTLNIYGIADNLVSALIDLGAGRNTVHHTDNVRVVN